MVAYICFSIALIILWDNLVACPFADDPSRHVYLRLLAPRFFIPPSGSLVLVGSTEKRLAAASPEFISAYFKTESLNFKSHFLFFCCTGAMAIISVILTDRKQHNT